MSARACTEVNAVREYSNSVCTDSALLKYNQLCLWASWKPHDIFWDFRVRHPAAYTMFRRAYQEGSSLALALLLPKWADSLASNEAWIIRLKGEKPVLKKALQYDHATCSSGSGSLFLGRLPSILRRREMSDANLLAIVVKSVVPVLPHTHATADLEQIEIIAPGPAYAVNFSTFKT